MKLFGIRHFLLALTTISCCYYTVSYANIKKSCFLSIRKKFEALEISSNGKIGIYAVNTENNQFIKYHALDRFPTQSTFKVIAVSAILKKSVENTHLLKEKVIYTKKDLVFWSPITEKHVADGMTVFELCAASLMHSDNTATNLIMKKLGGPKAVTAFARSIGDDTLRIDHWEPNLNSSLSNAYDTSTPAAMANNLQKLTLGNALPSHLRKQLVTWMKGSTTGDARIRAGIPKGWMVADKTGTGSYGVTNDIALIWPPHCAPIIVAIYFIQNKKEALPRDAVIAEATKLIIQKFSRGSYCMRDKNTILSIADLKVRRGIPNTV